jgi:hypothetical protein
LARPPLNPADQVPAVGVGDLLRYNSGTNRPITSFYSAELHDLTGDGLPDLIACVEWSVYPYYAHAALMMPEPPRYRLLSH